MNNSLLVLILSSLLLDYLTNINWIILTGVLQPHCSALLYWLVQSVGFVILLLLLHFPVTNLNWCSSRRAADSQMICACCLLIDCVDVCYCNSDTHQCKFQLTTFLWCWECTFRLHQEYNWVYNYNDNLLLPLFFLIF